MKTKLENVLSLGMSLKTPVCPIVSKTGVEVYNNYVKSASESF